jgi:hypothetical protein
MSSEKMGSLKNQAGMKRCKEFGQLLIEFKHACLQVMKCPDDVEFHNKILVINDNYSNSLQAMYIAVNETSKNFAVWTDKYFLSMLTVLNNWSSLICRMYGDLRDAGVDTKHALECCLISRETIRAVMAIEYHRYTSLRFEAFALGNLPRTGDGSHVLDLDAGVVDTILQELGTLYRAETY